MVAAREARRREHDVLERTLSGADRGPNPTPWHGAIHLVDFASLRHSKVRHTTSLPDVFSGEFLKTTGKFSVGIALVSQA